MQIIILDLSDRAVLYQLRKRQSNCVLCTASKARTWIWKLYNYKDWRQSGVSKSVLLRYRCRRKREFFSLINTRIFQKEKDSSLFIWLHHMPTEVVIAFYGTNATGEALAKELYNYCVNKPEIPDVAMSFSKPNVKALCRWKCSENGEH